MGERTPKETGTRSDFDAAGKPVTRSINHAQHEGKESSGENYPGNKK